MFGDVRSLLQEAPSPFVWDALTWNIEQASAEELKVQLMPYLEHHLARWPASLKQLPSAWKQRLSRGESPQGVGLVQEVHFNQHDVRALNAQARWRILDHEATAHIKRISFHYAELGDEDLDQLVRHLNQREVSALNLTSNPSVSEAALLRFLSSARLEHLEELQLGSCPALTHDGVRALLSAPWAAGISTLNVQSTRLRDDSIVALMDAAVRHQWRGLDVSNNSQVNAHLERLLSHGPIALRDLGLATCGLDDAQVRVLCARGARGARRA